jgi:hypothetical protein
MKWYLRACPVCAGDLHDDLEDRGWVTCFMCARSFRASELELDESQPAVATRFPARELPAAA